MLNLLDWLTALGFDMPGLTWLKVVIAGVLLLLIVDGFLGFLYTGIYSLISGGKR